jgi:hypothetical protein
MSETFEIGDWVTTPQGNAGEVVSIEGTVDAPLVITRHDHGDRSSRGEFPPGVLKKIDPAQRPVPTKQEQKRRAKEVPLPGAPTPVPPNDPTER